MSDQSIPTAHPASAPPEDEKELLIELLADRDVPCPRCEYNLRTLTTPRCPECGDELKLRLALVEPRIRAYVVTVAGCCFGLGQSLLILLMVAFVEGPQRVVHVDWCRVLFLEAIVMAIALAAVVRSQVWLRQRTGAIQWRIAIAAWALILVFGCGFLSSI